jgi:hypothetical protein
LVFSARAANILMTASCPQGSIELEQEARTGGSGAACMARAHPHMPWRRNRQSPLRASGGSGSPKAALRKVSYWAMIEAASSAERSSVLPDLTL